MKSLMTLVVMLIALMSGACVDGILGSRPVVSKRGAECGATRIETVADSSLPAEARAMYPQIQITVNTCPAGK